MFRRCVHDIDPNWQCQLPTERATINLLWLIETGPDRAGDVAVVTGEERVGEIISRSRFSSGRKFLQTEFSSSRFPDVCL